MPHNPPSHPVNRAEKDVAGHFPSKNIAQHSVGPINAAKLHALYLTEINENEKVWRDRYTFLLGRGLELRSRYRPNWTPSWLGTTLDPAYCDDSIEQILPMVLDAKWHKDGSMVCIKLIERKTDEVDIGRYLSSEKMLRNPRNHCVPILETFQDPFLPDVNYITMPILRPYDDPEFLAIGEVVDFTTQILEGMDFMHSHLVAHGDLTGPNIMMDARPILPHGWHFIADNCLPNGVDQLSPLSRMDHPVRYYIVDYDCSTKYQPGRSHIVTGFGGRDGDVPEIAKHQPHDPFKVDIFTVGNVLFKDFYQRYHGLEFLKSLIDLMMTQDFRQRPTAYAAIQHWHGVKSGLDVLATRWRLRKRDETVRERVLLDTVAAARHGIHSVKRLFNGYNAKTEM